MLRSFAFLFCLLLGALSAPARAVEEVVFWYGATFEEKRAIEEMIADFQRQHPGIRVRGMLTPMQQIQQKLLLSVAGGVPPDVVRFYTDLGGELMAREGLEPLDELARRDGVNLNDYFPVSVEQNTYKGRLYGMPWVLSPKALLYNRRLFREAGLDPDRPPRTWEELREAAIRLTKKDARGNITQLGYADVNEFRTYLWQNGGALLTQDKHYPAFQGRIGVETVEFWRNFQDQVAGSREAMNAFSSQFSGAATDPFGMERLAMRLDNPFRLPDLQRYFPNLDYAATSIPIPVGGHPATEVVGNSLVIPRGSRHKEAAWAFVRFAAQREQLLRVCKQSGRLPAHIGAAMDPIYTEHPILGAFVRELPHGRTLPLVPGYMEMTDALNRQLEQAFNHKKTPEAALETAASEAERILSRSNEDMSAFAVVRWRPVLTTLGAILVALVVGAAAWLLRATRRSRRERHEALEFLLFLAPWLAGFLLLTFGAVAASLVLSFTKWDVLTPGRWVGIRNYTDMFRHDPRLIKSLVNTGVYTVMAVPVSVVAGLATAMLLNQKVAGIRLFRTIFYLPVVVSGVATAILWVQIFNPTTGILNRLLTLPLRPEFSGGFRLAPLLANPPGWLTDPVWSKPALVLMALWGVGGGMLIYLAGLQGIPTQLYEAADLDGARAWHKFRHVTLPLLTPVIFYQLIMGIIGSFQVFTQAFVMTGGTGAPEDSLLFYVLYLFNNAFQWLKIGYSSAMAWLLFLIVLIVTFVNLVMAKRWVHYEGGKP